MGLVDYVNKVGAQINITHVVPSAPVGPQHQIPPLETRSCLMPFSPERLQSLLHPALSAAFRAGQRIMRHYGRIEEIGSKGRAGLAGDVVTVADREAQAVIVQTLRDLDPRIGMVAEEEGEDRGRSRFEKEAFWCIDPMDGTLPFLERNNGFAVSIALVARDGQPLLGVAHAPALGDTFWAASGCGAFHNGHPICLAPAEGILRVSMAWNDVASAETHARFLHIVEGLRQLKRVKSVEVMMHSGAVVRACRVCEKPPMIYMSLPREGGASIWDFAATACIVPEAGGWASDIFGKPMDLNRRDSTFMYHKGILYASDEELARVVIERYAQGP